MMVGKGYLAKVNFINNKVMYSFFLINKNCYRLSILSFTVLEGFVFLSKINLGYIFKYRADTKRVRKTLYGIINVANKDRLIIY